MTEPTELLPCPFCGAAAHFEMDEGRWEWVECESCGMQGNRSASLMEDCKPKLAEAWNRRTPAPVGVEPVASVHKDTLAMLNSGQVRPWDGGARLYPASKSRFDTDYVGVFAADQVIAMRRVPLTPERIREIERNHVYSQTATLTDLVRTVERAHGIGIKKENCNG